MTGAAGSTSKQLSMKQRGEELFTVGKLKEGGGTEGHDVMYGSEDPVEDPHIFEVPEIFPEKFQGAAGMSSKDISHSSAAGGPPLPSASPSTSASASASASPSPSPWP